MVKVIVVFMVKSIFILTIGALALVKKVRRRCADNGRPYLLFHFPTCVGKTMAWLSAWVDGKGLGTPGLAIVTHNPKGSCVILFDDLMERFSPLTRAFIYLHEEGHVGDDHFFDHLGTVECEVAADMYAVRKLNLSVEDVESIFDEMIKYCGLTIASSRDAAVKQAVLRKEEVVFLLGG